jgi:hypothetical protein
MAIIKNKTENNKCWQEHRETAAHIAGGIVGVVTLENSLTVSQNTKHGVTL